MKRISSFLTCLFAALFDPEAEKSVPWLGPAWLAALFLAGLGLLAKFMNFGNIPMDFEDWAEITGPRLAFWKDAVTRGILPLHVSDPSVLRAATDRFFAVPDVLASPQVFLLRFFSIGQFVLIDTLLFYAIGFMALLLLRKRFSLALVPFTVLFFLFNFNGHILSHLSIGHANWTGYFLFPWLAWLVFQLFDGTSSGWRWPAFTAIVLWIMYLQGAFHQFVWWILFLALIAIFNWKTILPIVKALGFAVLLSLVRILPTAADAGKFGGEFIGGYTTFTHLVWAMVLPRSPWQAVANQLALPFSTVSWWEFDLFVGLIGFLFLVIFGLVLWIRSRSSQGLYPGLLVPILAMVALSIGQVYQIVMALHIPLFDGERVSSRIISLPFVFILILAVMVFQRWINQPGRTAAAGWAILAALVIQIADQWQYIRLWQVSNIYPNLTHVDINLATKVVANHPDLVYTNLLWAGAAISLVSLAVLIVLAVKDSSAKVVRA